jgi:uncharacterized SAM-binding protein YcdF (DUF218 family)
VTRRHRKFPSAALAVCEPSKPRLGHMARKAIWIIAIVLVADVGWILGLLSWSHMITAEPNSAVDGIAVLYADSGSSISRTVRSLDRALALRRNYTSALILCIGGNRARTERHWGTAMASYLENRSIPKDAIILDRVSYDTRSNLRMLNALAQEYSLRHIVVIAHPAHAPRVHFQSRQLSLSQPIHIVYPEPLPGMLESLRDIWVSTHHEMLAWPSLLLPESFVDALLRRLRS